MTENKGAFTVTKTLHRLVPVALFLINYNNFPGAFRDKHNACLSFLTPNNIPHSSNRFKFCRRFVSLATLHLIALFWIPSVHWQLRKNTNHTFIKTLARGWGLVTNYLITNTTFSACITGHFLRKLLTGSCFVLVRRNIPKRRKYTAAAGTPSPLRDNAF